MKREVKRKVKDDGTYIEITTTTTTPEDGFVPNMNKMNADDSSYVKGYQVNTHFETNDPRIVKPFLYGTAILFYIITFILLFNKVYFFGIMFLTFTTIFVIGVTKETKKNEQELLKNPTYDHNDKEVIKEFGQTIKDEFKETSDKTFTKDSFKWVVKTSIPIYAVISIIISIILSIILGIILSSILYGILIFVGSLILFTILIIIYFALISLLFRH